MPPDELKKLRDVGVQEDKIISLLNKAKQEIEEDVQRYTLDRKGIGLRPNIGGGKLHCVLLGKAGQGKSSLGNLLLGKYAFIEHGRAGQGTKDMQYGSSDLIEVIDTPGLADMDDKDLGLDLSKVWLKYIILINSFSYLEAGHPLQAKYIVHCNIDNIFIVYITLRAHTLVSISFIIIQSDRIHNDFKHLYKSVLKRCTCCSDIAS